MVFFKIGQRCVLDIHAEPGLFAFVFGDMVVLVCFERVHCSSCFYIWTTNCGTFGRWVGSFSVMIYPIYLPKRSG